MAAACGVNVAAVTPRREGPEADLAATFELIDYLCTSGVSGLTLMGSTGEFIHYEMGERIKLVSLAVKRSRVPVIAGVTHSTLDGAVALARAAGDAGAAAVLLAPPYFFPYGQDEVREFFLRFAKEMKDGPPILLYNIPSCTTGIACGAALDLLSTGLFAGIKDSSADYDNFARLNAARPQTSFTLLVGHDSIFRKARAAGADGLISGCACAVPELLIALDRAILAGKDEVADRLDARLQEFLSWMGRFPAPAAIREATALRGLSVGPHALPLGPDAEANLEKFREWFRGWLPAVTQECRDE